MIHLNPLLDRLEVFDPRGCDFCPKQAVAAACAPWTDVVVVRLLCADHLETDATVPTSDIRLLT